jgi:hypothetical protein
MRRSSRDCPRQTFTGHILPKAARTEELIWITAGCPFAYPTIHMHPNKHRSVWLWFLVCDWLMIDWSVVVLDGFTAAQVVNKLSRFANRSITHRRRHRLPSYYDAAGLSYCDAAAQVESSKSGAASARSIGGGALSASR